MKALNDKQKILAAQNHNLIYAFLNRYHLSQDEYYGDMAETYCLAIASYRREKGKVVQLHIRLPGQQAQKYIPGKTI